MVFKSAKELENYILSHSKAAIEQAREKVYDVIAGFLFKYYDEFEPKVYERTLQLLSSLVKENVVPTKNGWKTEVYFDIKALDYSTKLRNGIKVPNKGWSEEATLHEAMVGHSHGGYVNPYGENTAIWTSSMEVLDKDAIETLKQELINAGIPIK